MMPVFPEGISAEEMGDSAVGGIGYDLLGRHKIKL